MREDSGISLVCVEGGRRAIKDSRQRMASAKYAGETRYQKIRYRYSKHKMKVSVPIKAMSVNDAFQGRRFKTPECKQYEEDLWMLLPRMEKVMGRVRIVYRFFLVNHALTDFDNLIKITQDILVKKGYIEDDRKIYDAHIQKIPSKEDSIEIEIYPI